MTAEPAAGPRIIGRYALFAQIAAGGMAAVHLGRLLGQAGFSRTVAIKRLHPHLAQDPEFVSMLLDEARLAARIRHPNVVSTIDVVALEGELLVVMDYVHGESLSRLLSKLRQRNATVPPAIASAIISGVLYGLHSAHEAKSESGLPLQIIHRDVSPQNVMVGADGVARVVDFGVAKAAGRLQETREGQLKGKIRYMAPEQLKRGDVDRAADIYAASVVLWECLTGKRLFDDDNEWQIAHSIMEGASTPPSKLVDSVPKELDAIVMQGLSPDRGKRFKTAFDMAAALEEAVPPATARQVAAWVDQVAADAIRARAEKLAEVEGQSKELQPSEDSSPNASGSWPRSSSANLLVGPPPAELSHLSNLSNLTTAQFAKPAEAPPPSEASEPSHTAHGIANTFSPPPPAIRAALWSRPPVLGAMVAGGVVLVGLVLYAAMGSGSKPPTATATQPTRATPVTAPTPAPEPSTAEVTPAPTAEPSAAPEPSATAEAPPKKKAGTSAGSGKVFVPVKPKAASCNPPYFFDAKGVKHFKPECL